MNEDKKTWVRVNSQHRVHNDWAELSDVCLLLFLWLKAEPAVASTFECVISWKSLTTEITER